MKDLFDKYIIPILKERKPKTILEIGVLTGGVTIKALEYCRKYSAKVTSVEPVAWAGNIPEEISAPAPGFHSGYLDNIIVPEYIEKVFEQGLDKYWVCKKMTSIQYLASEEFKGFDMYLIDGDHNYYTLYNELVLIHRWTKKGDVIFIHDVVKWGKRDQYYDESAIPIKYLYGKKQGLLRSINDFIKDTTYYHFRLLINRIPILTKKVKNYQYTTVTRDQYGLGCLERI